MSHWIVESGKSPSGLAWRKDSKGRVVRRDKNGHTTRERLNSPGIFDDVPAEVAEGYIDWEPVE